jgi:hypothetical protein
MQGHDVPFCRLFFATASVLRNGALFWEDRGCIDGATLPWLTHQRHIDGMVPLQSTMVSYQEAVQRAARPGEWQRHPSRDHQHMALVKGVEHVWEGCPVALKAWVIRSWSRKKTALDPMVLVTADQRLMGPWIVRHDEERPEMEQDDQQRQSGGWQRKQRSATRDSAIVLYMATVVLSDSLYPLCSNTRAGARFADKTRQALAFEPLRSRRTPIMAYAGGYLEIFETLSFVRCVLQPPAAVQERLRHWLDKHLHTVQQRE